MPVPPGRNDPPAFRANLAALGARLARTRIPDADGKRRRRRLALAGAVAAGLVILLFVLALDARSVAWGPALPPALATFFALATRLGESPWQLIPTGVFALGLLFVDWRRVRRRLAAAWIELGCLAAFYLLAIAASGMATNLVKWTVGRSRPVRFAEDGVLTLSPISFGFEHVSFPSGHTTTATAAATALALILGARPPVVMLAFLYVLTIGLSRVMVGVHFPSDLVAGMFVGGTVTFALAHWLGARGVVFQGRADGTLLPKTIALRRQLRRRRHRADTRPA
jgi:membrane-associated phospholipid phosphatase